MIKLFYLIIIITCLSAFHSSTQVYYCCCNLEQDKFRGFQNKGYNIIELNTEFLPRRKIKKSIIDDCLDKKGYPDLNSYRKIINGISILKPNCEKECEDTRKTLNDKFIKEVELEKKQEILRLKDKKTQIKAQLVNNSKNQSSLLTAGLSLTSRNNYKSTNLISVKIKGRNNGVANSNLTFASSDSNLSCDIFNTLCHNENNMTYDDNLKVNTSSEMNHSISTQKPKQELKLKNTKIIKESNNTQLDLNAINIEIDVLCKEKRPLDYIIERFSIDDRLLIKLIKLFQKSLEAVFEAYKKEILLSLDMI